MSRCNVLFVVILLLLLNGNASLLREGQNEQQSPSLPTRIPPLAHSTRPSSPLRDTKTKIAMINEKEKMKQRAEEAIEQEKLRQIEATKELQMQEEIDKKRQINREAKGTVGGSLKVEKEAGLKEVQKQRVSTEEVIDRVRIKIEEREQEEEQKLMLQSQRAITATSKAAASGHCVHRKKLIIDVDKSGFGNRLAGLTSAVMLALMTDRVLFLKWTPHHEKCGSSFGDLYETKHIISSPYKAFYMWNESDREINNVEVQEEECHLEFDQGYRLVDWHFLNNKYLFDRLNKECNTIYITANRYFGQFLYTIDHEYNHNWLLHLLGPAPFAYLSKCILKLNKKYHEDADWIVSRIHEYGTFLALHVRSYYSINEDISVTFKCVNKLLEEGIISKAFVLTDNLEYEKKARKLIRPNDAIVTMVKELEKSYTKESLSRGRLDSYHLRDEMHDAMKEFLVLGKADYCASTAVHESTFSQTAIMSGRCKYVNVVQGADCIKDVNRQNFSLSGNVNLFNQHAPRLDIINPHLDKEMLERYWQKLYRKKTTRHYPCLAKMKEGDIKQFWSQNKCS